MQSLLRRCVMSALDGWQHEPAEMAVKLELSAVCGQGVFWLLGYDQLGFFMKPRWEFGTGRWVARRVRRHLPAGAAVAWTVKAVELSTDALRAFTEAKVYERHRMTPDVMTAFLTPGLWTLGYEVPEKLLGVLLHPERVNRPDQVELSLACIYGSLFRYAQALALYYAGDALYAKLGQPQVNGLQRLLHHIR